MTAPIASRWFKTAANPLCRSWCARTHPAAVFSELGDMVCSAPVDVAGGFRFWVSQISTVDAEETPGVVEVLPPVLRGPILDDLDDQTPAGLRRYALALLQAAERLEEVSA